MRAEVHTAYDPKIKKQCPSFPIYSDNIGGLQPIVFIWIRWLDRITSRCISKHPIASHFNVDSVKFTITKEVWEYPFNTLSASS